MLYLKYKINKCAPERRKNDRERERASRIKWKWNWTEKTALYVCAFVCLFERERERRERNRCRTVHFNSYKLNVNNANFFSVVPVYIQAKLFVRSLIVGIGWKYWLTNKCIRSFDSVSGHATVLNAIKLCWSDMSMS